MCTKSEPPSTHYHSNQLNLTSSSMLNHMIENLKLKFLDYLKPNWQKCLIFFHFRSILDTVGKRIVHPCPYSGQIRIVDMSVENEMSVQFLKGQYKITFKMLNEEDDDIITIHNS
ncbi:CLUMA_CG007903, isoform A [Clunio marinus]|uniref:CLUMA_CG007903, isoform A n=1 Tax=Clunio marinus TaxID=568069 RepID=A0A1J1I474_9DIPT|nr:CLUMA_CG007903, isoform A [Clunio marinus]